MAIKNKKYKASIILIITLLLIVGGFIVYKRMHKAAPANISTVTKPEINYRPPTKQEKQAGNDAKTSIVEHDAQVKAAQNQQGLKLVTPVITNASFSAVHAYVSGIFEDGGTCSATFTQGGTIITRTSTGFENVSDTQCAPITPNLPNNNSWSVVITYNSSTAQGSSKAVEVQ